MIQGSALFSSSEFFLKKPQASISREIIERQFIGLYNIQPKFINEHTEHILNYLYMNVLFISAGTPTAIQDDVDGLGPSCARATWL